MKEDEDLEILKEFLELRELHSSNSIPKSYLTIYQETVRNLIARYKELEEEIENWKFTKKYVEENYIDKSKVKEKIEELRKIHKERDFTNKEAYYLDCYKEMLED